MSNRSRAIGGVLLAGLAMSVGWGIRGDYGHEAGAMIPGALLGLAVCAAGGREDWWRRASIMGMCGALGWAFGGQMSYGRIIGYTASSSPADVCYGYACLFVIGGLWAGVGSAILARSITQSASHLERFARPLVVLGVAWFGLATSGLTDRLVSLWSLHDTDWVGASSAILVAGVCAVLFPTDRSACGLVALLAAGWWIGYLVLTVLLGLHMTPPRSDNWAGSVGLFSALVLYLLRRRDRVAVTAAAWGVLIGGAGFVLGDFLNMLGRAQWGPIGRCAIFQELDTWKWMEQSFGFIMGLGVGSVFLLRIAPRISSPPADDPPSRRLRTVSLVLLLPVMMYLNLSKNITSWVTRNQVPGEVLGISATAWLRIVGILVLASLMVAILRRHRGTLAILPESSFGRAQLLFLMVLWVFTVGTSMQALPAMSSRATFLVQMSFWVTAGICSLIVLALPGRAVNEPNQPCPASADSWRLGWRFWVSLCLVPLLLLAVAWMTRASHREALPGSHVRFGDLEASTSP
ncbi:MAG TPA: hypothetical protein PKH24_03470 [Sedimentisphaerales bacterium]|jgi:hypothetical protein|nr:hypothetical protein [Sedimentisphaerales bacterium]HNU28507.1 hypothetical protein [Sedimentisphaerales bacterium]